MYTLTINIATADELQEVVNLLNGVPGVEVEQPAAPVKATTNKAKGAAATAAAFKEPPAKAPAVKGKKALTVDDVKGHILDHAGDGPESSANVKEYVKTFGVAKLSDMDQPTLNKAHAGAEAYFAALGGDGEDGGEDDPMA